MSRFVKELRIIIGEDLNKIPLMMAFFLVISIMDLIAIGLIGPFLVLVSSSSPIENIINQYLGINGIRMEHNHLVLTVGLSLIALFIARAIAAIWMNRAILAFCGTVRLSILGRLFKIYQNQEYIEYSRRNSSDYVHVLLDSTRRFDEYVMLPILRTSSDVIFGIVIVIFLLYSNFDITLMLLLVCISMFFLYNKFIKVQLYRHGAQVNYSSVFISKWVRESIVGLKELKLLGRLEHFESVLLSEASALIKANTSALTYAVSPRYIIELLVASFIVFLGIYSAGIVDQSTSLIGIIGMFGLSALRLLPAVNNLMLTVTHLKFHRECVQRIYSDLLLRQDNPDRGFDRRDLLSSSDNFRSIQFDGVSFRYSNDEDYVIRDASVSIDSGCAVGIIGLSGSGKTTFLNLFLSLLSPTDGRILVNGLPLECNIEYWRSKVAYLPQDAFLVDGTFKQNIALGVSSSDINYAALYEAARQARILEFIVQQPSGFDAEIGEGGCRLSGGQRQRVSLARALYFDREVLVFDEATSSLDLETESEIVDEIRTLKKRKTIIIVAHRLSTLRDCDLIYTLNSSRLLLSSSKVGG